MRQFKESPLFQVISVLLPDTLQFYELEYDQLYSIDQLYIIYPEFYNIYKHVDLIEELKEKIQVKYETTWGHLIHKNLLLIKRNLYSKSILPIQCDRLVDQLISVGFEYVQPEKENIFKMIFTLMNAHNIVFSNGAIVYFNKIFLNPKTHVYTIDQHGYESNYHIIPTPCYYHHFQIPSLDLDSHLDTTTQIIHHIQSTMKPKMSEWILWHKTRNLYDGKEDELPIHDTCSYGSHQISFSESLQCLQTQYQCAQVVYCEYNQRIFPMKRCIMDPQGGKTDSFITALRYPIDVLPRVAVIIPTYNRFSFLKRSFTSILEQTYPHLDIFITDDASTEDRIDQKNFIQTMRHEHPHRTIHYLENDTNVGFTKNINRALRLLTTDQPFFYLLFDDDWVEPRLIQVAVHLFRIYHNISFIEFNAYNDLETRSDLYEPFYKGVTSIDTFVMNYLENENIKTCQSPANRVFRNLNLRFQETPMGELDDLCLRRGSGFDFYFIYQHLRIIQQFYFCQEPLIHFTSHGESCSVQHLDFVCEKARYIMRYCQEDYLKIQNKK